MIISKLPLQFQNDLVISAIAKYFQKSTVMYSSIIYQNKEKQLFLINKNQNTPYFSKDWQCYSLLRAISNSFVTSGSIIRNQKNSYKSVLSFSDQNIQQMYNKLRGDKKPSVYVMTKTMNNQEILKQFNTNIYQVLDQVETQKKQSLYQIVQNIKDKQKTPILIQCGTNIMNSYYEQIELKQLQSQIDTILLTFYQGFLNQDSIGAQFKLNLQKYMQCVWKSDYLDVFDIENNKIGANCFKIYQKIK